MGVPDLVRTSRRLVAVKDMETKGKRRQLEPLEFGLELSPNEWVSVREPQLVPTVYGLVAHEQIGRAHV